MRNTRLPLLLFCVLSSSSYAYNFEFSADLDRGLQEANPSDQNLQGRSFAFDMYFKDVTLEKGPLAEAAFLNRASVLSIAKQKVRNDDLSQQSKYRNLTLNYVFDKKWSLQGSMLKNNVISVRQDGWSIGGGYYLFKDSLLTLDFSRLDDDSPEKKKIVEWDLNWKSLFAVGEESWLSLELGHRLYDEEGDDTVANSIRTVWYPNNRWAYEFGFRFNDKEDADEFVGRLGVSSFVGDQLELFVAYEQIYTEHDIVEDFDTQNVNMGFNLRF